MERKQSVFWWKEGKIFSFIPWKLKFQPSKLFHRDHYDDGEWSPPHRHQPQSPGTPRSCGSSHSLPPGLSPTKHEFYQDFRGGWDKYSIIRSSFISGLPFHTHIQCGNVQPPPPPWPLSYWCNTWTEISWSLFWKPTHNLTLIWLWTVSNIFVIIFQILNFQTLLKMLCQYWAKKMDYSF